MRMILSLLKLYNIHPQAVATVVNIQSIATRNTEPTSRNILAPHQFNTMLIQDTDNAGRDFDASIQRSAMNWSILST